MSSPPLRFTITWPRLIEGNDHSTTRASEEITDITDADGEYTASTWETW